MNPQPLVFRDGRPNDGRSESRTLPFPLPSTLVGAVRTVLGRRKGVFDRSLIASLLANVSIRGPLLATSTELLVPAPGDALILGDSEDILCAEALERIRRTDGATSDIGLAVWLVGRAAGSVVKAKPFQKAPRFWSWTAYEEWLRDPSTRDDPATRKLLSSGVVALEREERVHVALGPYGTALDGKLFATEGLRLAGKVPDMRTRAQKEADEAAGVSPVSHVALDLLLDVDVREASLGAVAGGLRPLGGERRISRWSVSNRPLPPLPAWLAAHVEQGEEVVVRVLLLTPAHVKSSHGPERLARPGVAEILAAKVDRPRVISGWDMASGPPGGWPKPTRRLAESGSVFWVRLFGPVAERRRWLDDIWMRNISDDPQLALDGFGLAAIGVGSES